MKQTANPVIAIFGITGDLSRRYLLPALYHLLRSDVLPAETKIVGISRRPLSVEELLSTVELCVLEKDKVCDPEGLRKVHRSLSTFQLDPSKDEDYESLKSLLDSYDSEAKRERLFYMSVPSAAYEPIVTHLGQHRLNDDRSRILLEKPFGYDLKSAKELIKTIHQSFKEEQIYRIDHYLAKETAQNLLAFRLHNPIFKPIWSCRYISRVHVRILETLGIEGRVNFYEQTGTLRDFTQSHLMQLLSITLMDLPKDMSSQAIHASKEKFLKGLKPADPKKAQRAQYDSYRKEVNNPNSNIDTYSRLELSHDAPNWQDTEIILEVGKALDQKITDVTIEFKTAHERRRDQLVFQIQPNEAISLDLMVKEPGFDNRMHHASLDFRYKDTFSDYQQVDAYERVLMDAVRSDQSLFASTEEVLETWRVLQPVIDAWKADTSDIPTYTAGSKEPRLE